MRDEVNYNGKGLLKRFFKTSVNGIFFFAFLLFTFLVNPLTYLDRINISEWIVLLAFIPIGIFGIWFMDYRYKRQLDKYNPNGFGKKDIELKYVALAVGMSLLSMLLKTSLLDAIGTAPKNQEAIDAIANQWKYLVPISSVLLGPVLEEYLFRGVFFNYFFNEDKRWCNVLAILTSAFLFGFLHELKISLVLIVYLIPGLIYGIVYMTTKDIRYTIGMHLANNFIAAMPLIIKIITT